MRLIAATVAAAAIIVGGLFAARAFSASAKATNVLTGQAAFASYTNEKPGTFRKITVRDLPEPYATTSVRNAPSRIVPRPDNAWPQVPQGFQVQLFATGFREPRLMRTAPNGDVFLADSTAGKIIVFHGVTKEGKAEVTSEFATGLNRPFGINFFPASGSAPQYIYVGNTDSVVRFLYKDGDLKARGPAEPVVKSLPSGAEVVGGGGHWTRDVVFSRDFKKMFVSVGSRSNVDDTDNNPSEFHRADVLEYNPDGSGVRVYAYGIRNCVGEAVQPETGDLWCSTNERDELGDNLPPDYITHIQDGGFYGWPWFYIGPHQDPRHQGKHPELRDKVIVPDVLVQPHLASLEMMFYEGSQFPSDYKGDIFAAEHGSWNKALRAGYELVRVPLEGGKAGGEYEDFMTGFVTPDGEVWGRPVGVTMMNDGSLLVSDDGSRSIWRVSYVAGSH